MGDCRPERACETMPTQPRVFRFNFLFHQFLGKLNFKIFSTILPVSKIISRLLYLIVVLTCSKQMKLQSVRAVCCGAGRAADDVSGNLTKRTHVEI